MKIPSEVKDFIRAKIEPDAPFWHSFDSPLLLEAISLWISLNPKINERKAKALLSNLLYEVDFLMSYKKDIERSNALLVSIEEADEASFAQFNVTKARMTEVTKSIIAHTQKQIRAKLNKLKNSYNCDMSYLCEGVF